MTFKRSNFPVALVLLLAACGETVAPLNAEEKARYYSENLQADPRCATFREQLARPNPTLPGVEAIYIEAVRASCQKRDI